MVDKNLEIHQFHDKISGEWSNTNPPKGLETRAFLSNHKSWLFLQCFASPAKAGINRARLAWLSAERFGKSGSLRVRSPVSEPFICLNPVPIGKRIREPRKPRSV